MQKPAVIRLVGNLREELKLFLRQELELIKAEIAEKAANYRGGTTALAAGGVAAYAALIVLLVGLGFLLSLLFIKIGVVSVLARFAGFAVVGLVVAGSGTWLLVSSLNVLSKESVAPKKTIQTIQRLIPPEAIPTKPTPKRPPLRPSKVVETDALATQERLTKTLEQVTWRTNPTRYINLTIREVQAHPYRWGMVALAAGFAASFVTFRLFAPAKSS